MRGAFGLLVGAAMLAIVCGGLSGCAGARSSGGGMLQIAPLLQVGSVQADKVRAVTAVGLAPLSLASDLRSLSMARVRELEGILAESVERELDIALVGKGGAGASPSPAEAVIEVLLRSYRDVQPVEGEPFAEVGFQISLIGSSREVIWSASYHKADRPLTDNLLLNRPQQRGQQGLRYRKASELFAEGMAEALRDLRQRRASGFRADQVKPN